MRLLTAALLALAVTAVPAAAQSRLLGIPAHVPAGGRLQIRWAGLGDDVQEAELELSLGGGRWLRVSPELEARDGGFTWVVPAGLSGPARLRLPCGGERFEAEGCVASFVITGAVAETALRPTFDAWWWPTEHTVTATGLLAGAASLSRIRLAYAIAPVPMRQARLADAAATGARTSTPAAAAPGASPGRRGPSRRYPLRI